MKSFLKIIFPFLALMFLLTNCSKNDTIYKAYFYTPISESHGKLSLYIDDEYRGDIPYMSMKPNCENDSLKEKALFLNLVPGKYKLVAKNSLGEIMSSGTLKFSKNKLSSSGGYNSKGGQEIYHEGECLIVGMY